MSQETDPVIKHVVSISKVFGSVYGVLLFGSRATGRDHRKSDYDLAIFWKDHTTESWGDYAERLREKNPSLNQLDLVRWDLASNELKEKILLEGKVVYDQGKTKLPKLGKSSSGP